MSAQVTYEDKQSQSYSNEVIEVFHKLRCDLRELYEMTRFAKGYYVKDAISLDINLLAAKIESVEDVVYNRENNGLKWSEAVASKRITGSNTQNVELNLRPGTTINMNCLIAVAWANMKPHVQQEVINLLESVNQR
jgi:hypothetical protein